MSSARVEKFLEWRRSRANLVPDDEEVELLRELARLKNVSAKPLPCTSSPPSASLAAASPIVADADEATQPAGYRTVLCAPPPTQRYFLTDGPPLRRGSLQRLVVADGDTAGGGDNDVRGVILSFLPIFPSEFEEDLRRMLDVVQTDDLTVLHAPYPLDPTTTFRPGSGGYGARAAAAAPLVPPPPPSQQQQLQVHKNGIQTFAQARQLLCDIEHETKVVYGRRFADFASYTIVGFGIGGVQPSPKITATASTTPSSSSKRGGGGRGSLGPTSLPAGRFDDGTSPVDSRPPSTVSITPIGHDDESPLLRAVVEVQSSSSFRCSKAVLPEQAQCFDLLMKQILCAVASNRDRLDRLERWVLFRETILRERCEVLRPILREDFALWNDILERWSQSLPVTGSEPPLPRPPSSTIGGGRVGQLRSAVGGRSTSRSSSPVDSRKRPTSRSHRPAKQSTASSPPEAVGTAPAAVVTTTVWGEEGQQAIAPQPDPLFLVALGELEQLKLRIPAVEYLGDPDRRWTRDDLRNMFWDAADFVRIKRQKQIQAHQQSQKGSTPLPENQEGSEEAAGPASGSVVEDSENDVVAGCRLYSLPVPEDVGDDYLYSVTFRQAMNLGLTEIPWVRGYSWEDRSAPSNYNAATTSAAVAVPGTDPRCGSPWRTMEGGGSRPLMPSSSSIGFKKSGAVFENVAGSRGGSVAGVDPHAYPLPHPSQRLGNLSPASLRSVTPITAAERRGSYPASLGGASALRRPSGGSPMMMTMPTTRSFGALSDKSGAAGTGVQLLRTAASFRANPSKVMSFLGIETDVGAVQRQIEREWREERSLQKQEHSKIMDEAFQVATDAMTQRLWLSTMPFLPRTAHRRRGCEFCQATPVHHVGLPVSTNCGVTDPIALCNSCYETHFAWDPNDNGVAHRLFTWVSVRKLVGLYARRNKRKLRHCKGGEEAGRDDDFSFAGTTPYDDVDDDDDDEDSDDERSWLIPNETESALASSTPPSPNHGPQPPPPPPPQAATLPSVMVSQLLTPGGTSSSSVGSSRLIPITATATGSASPPMMASTTMRPSSGGRSSSSILVRSSFSTPQEHAMTGGRGVGGPQPVGGGDFLVVAAASDTTAAHASSSSSSRRKVVSTTVGGVRGDSAGRRGGGGHEPHRDSLSNEVVL